VPTDLLACWVFPNQRLTCCGFVLHFGLGEFIPTFSLLQLERTKGLSIKSKGIEVRVLLEWHFQWLVFLDPASQKASSRFLSHVSCFLLRLWNLWKTKKSCTSGSASFELLMTARIYSQFTSADLGPFEPGWPSPNSLSTYTRFLKEACNRHQSNPVLGPSFRPFKSSFNLKHYCLQTKDILLNLSIKCWNLVA